MSQQSVSSSPAPKKRARLDCLDALRGIVMILMALDHSRDFFSNSHAYFDPIDVMKTTPGFFFTRWITDFCAPVFSFLAGAGVYFASLRRTNKQVVKLLVTRGLWLIFLELTAMRCSWYFNFDFTLLKAGVLWSLGWSMIALAGLIYLPKRVLLWVSLAIVFGHNLLDVFRASDFGSFSWLWMLVHEKGFFVVPGLFSFKVVYQLIPWIGVMSAGYCFGEVLKWDADDRRRFILKLGIGLTLGYLALRGLNMYGDPQPWIVYKNWLYTAMSFLACEKYPPSVSYLLMTMGPAFLLLWTLDRDEMPKWLNPTMVFGRVPFLFYVLHLPILHAMGILWAEWAFNDSTWLFANPPGDVIRPRVFHWDLWLTYAGWAVVCLGLYPLCHWFSQVKARRRDLWWLSYL